MPLPDEIDMADVERDDTGHDALMDAIDAASDQDHTTWITADGRRIARIAPVDEIPDELLNLRPRTLADDEVAELLEFAGQVRAAMHRTREAYDILFGQAGSRVLRAGDRKLREALAAKRAETGPAWDAALAGSGPERIPVSRSFLTQVLTDAGLAQDKAQAVWEAIRDITSGPHPGGRPGGRFDRSGRPERLRPAGGIITVQVVQDVLSLVGVQISEEIVRCWSNGQASEAYDWAMRTHLAASDNDSAIPPRPRFLPSPGGPGHHTGMAEHDGLAAHSHEVLPDHDGVPRKNQG